MSRPEPSAVDVANVIERVFKRIPDGHWTLREVSHAVLMHFYGAMPGSLEVDPLLLEQVADQFRYDDGKGRSFEINSMVGAVAALQYDSLEALAERMQQVFVSKLEATEEGKKTDWFCPFCERSWNEWEQEPDSCPDCDALLMRATKLPKKEEAS